MTEQLDREERTREGPAEERPDLQQQPPAYAASHAGADRPPEAEPQDERRRGALDLIVDVVVAPAQAFRYLARRRHAGLAFLVAFAGILAEMATTRTSLSLEEFGGAAPPGPVATILSALFAAAVGVPLVAGILHLFARLLGGKGGFVLMLQAVGFSLVISLLAAPFQALDRVLETDVIGAAAGVAGGVWQLVLVVMAVREMYRMSTTRAAVAVLLPTLLGLGFLFFLVGVLMAGLAIL